MGKIGIFFGTDSGTTRLMAKKMARLLGDVADKPLNVNRIEVDDMLQYDALILGTPTYGDGQVPGLSTKVKDGSWEEFLPKLRQQNLQGKRVALYGLGDQEKYGERFASGLYQLYEAVHEAGAEIIGAWPVTDYSFEASRAVVDGQFVGLVIDNSNQPLMTDDRIGAWLEMIREPLLEVIAEPA